VSLVRSDPLAKNAKTWSGRTAGPPCWVCKTHLGEGHRYYDDEGETVVHYCCRAAEQERFRKRDMVDPMCEPEVYAEQMRRARADAECVVLTECAPVPEGDAELVTDSDGQGLLWG
jgi:hypothetical protein